MHCVPNPDELSHPPSERLPLACFTLINHYAAERNRMWCKRGYGYYRVILKTVKVAVSIPDTVFEAAEELAARRRCSRSSLYAQALERLLAAEDRDEVTARLDAVYAEEPSELDPALRDAQARALAERW